MDSACVCISIRKASRKLTALYDADLAVAGINLAQFSLLRNIKRHGPVSLTALAEIVDLDRSTLGRNMRVLERMGLVAIAAGRDQREATLTLTADGKSTVASATPLWEGTQAAIESRLGAEGVAQLNALLGAL
jgi:DNA-binding MarR family transcriptional regulator